MSGIAPLVRVGVIGCGTIAYWAHLRNLQHLRGAALVGVADPDPVARKRASDLVRGTIHDNTSELIDRPDIDAVIVSAPTLLHADLAMAAARAGKHVYVEKPVATTIADARAVMMEVARADVVAVVGFSFRHHPAHEHARTLLRAGYIGRVRAVQTAFCEPTLSEMMPEWKRRRQSGGGALLDLASHHIDLVRWYLNDEIAVVDACISSERTEHDTAQLALTTSDGVEVNTFVTFRAGPADFLEFIGEQGVLRVDRHAGSPMLRVSRRFGYGVRTVWTRPCVASTTLWLRRLVQPSYQPSFRRALAAFVARVQGRPVAVPTLDDGAKSLEVILAAEESARLRSSVTLS